MIICHDCKVIMRCVKTGSSYHFGNGHTYPGDTFECPQCNSRTAVCNSTSASLTPEQVDCARQRLGEWFVEVCR
jgi:hypothetical protein